MGKATFNVVKWMLTIFNFIFIVCGLTICAVGVWILVAPSTVERYIEPTLTSIISYFLLGIGGFIVLVSFCGCAGAGLENRCLLCMFFTVLCGIFVACLVGVILVIVFKDDLQKLSSVRLKETILNKYGDDKKWTAIFDKMQTLFQCCGVEDDSGIKIYQRTKWYKDKKVPESCCQKNLDQYVNKDQCMGGDKSSMNTKGCFSVIMDVFKKQYLIVLGVLIGLGVLLIFGMVLALVHLKNIIHDPYYEYSHPI